MAGNRPVHRRLALIGTLAVLLTGTGVVAAVAASNVTTSALAPSSVSLTATPASATAAVSSTTRYSLRLTRTNLAGPITLSVTGKLPAGLTAQLSPKFVTGASATLQLNAAAMLSDGTYSVHLLATGNGRDLRSHSARATVGLTVRTPHLPFRISGSPTGLLSPGVSRPINLVLTNPNTRPLRVINLSLRVQSVTRTSYARAHNLSCGGLDYNVRQYRGGYPLAVPAHKSVSLTGSGTATSALPRVIMLDRPVNQDGCKGATLTLAYSGTGQGS